jgi:hypothetical protein
MVGFEARRSRGAHGQHFESIIFAGRRAKPANWRALRKLLDATFTIPTSFFFLLSSLLQYPPGEIQRSGFLDWQNPIWAICFLEVTDLSQSDFLWRISTLREALNCASVCKILQVFSLLFISQKKYCQICDTPGCDFGESGYNPAALSFEKTRQVLARRKRRGEGTPSGPKSLTRATIGPPDYAHLQISSQSFKSHPGEMKSIMKIPRGLICIAALLAVSAAVQAQTWTTVTNTPPAALGTALLLTNGTVFAQGMQADGYATGNWYTLTPDSTGSYINGTWAKVGTMPTGYSPLYYASAVLSNGEVVTIGGEYNNNAEEETNLGAIYNPTTNKWTSLSGPTGWTHIGDAASVVLPTGTFMIGNCGVAGTECTNQTYQAQLNLSTKTWTVIGSGNGKADQNSEEGWELLPNGEVLTVDIWDVGNSELFNPSSSTWSSAGKTAATLPSTLCEEIGPAVLRPDGTVFAVGGIDNTGIYDSSTSVWSAGPTIPSNDGSQDGPAALLPDGNVLFSVAPTSKTQCYLNGSKFYEFNGSTLTSVPAPIGASGQPTYTGRMLVLPTGQVLFTYGTTTVQIYTPTGTYESSWQPVVKKVAATLTHGTKNNKIQGTQFNGLSQGAMYGDDGQMATNYPLVRITNTASGSVVYCRTHNHSTMSVATGSKIVATEFDIPATIETGASTIEVVANGIPSNPVNVTID